MSLIAQLNEGECRDHYGDHTCAQQDEGEGVEAEREGSNESSAQEHDNRENLQEQREAKSAPIIHNTTVVALAFDQEPEWASASPCKSRCSICCHSYSSPAGERTQIRSKRSSGHVAGT